MKKLFLTLAIAVIGFTTGYAQTAAHKEKATPAQKAERSTAKLQKELSLNADQKQKIYAIELEKFQKAESMHKSGHEAKQVQKDQHKAIKRETEAKLDKVINPEQKKKLAALQAEKKAKKAEKKAAKTKKS
jgi:protein CpxP